MCESAFSAVLEGRVAKGDVLGIARIAGIQAAKRTSDWIPLCHPLSIESVEIQLEPNSARLAVDIEARVLVTAKTGVEMEAMVAASAAALTIYDMCKSLDRAMEIEFVRLVRKSGGKSGVYERTE